MPAPTPEHIPESQQENSRDLIRLQTKDGLKELRADLERARSFKSYSPEFSEKLQKGVTYDDLIGVLETGTEKLSVPKVFALQILLTELGINPLENLDGIYANKLKQPLRTAEKTVRRRSTTERAVADFQERFRSKYPDVIGKNEHDGIFRQKYSAILRQELQQELPQKVSARAVPALTFSQQAELQALFAEQGKRASENRDWPFVSKMAAAQISKKTEVPEIEVKLPEVVKGIDLPQTVQRRKVAPKEALHGEVVPPLMLEDFALKDEESTVVSGVKSLSNDLVLISFRDRQGAQIRNIFRLQTMAGRSGEELEQLVLINPRDNSVVPELTWTRKAQAGEKFDLTAFPLFKMKEFATGK